MRTLRARAHTSAACTAWPPHSRGASSSMRSRRPGAVPRAGRAPGGGWSAPWLGVLRLLLVALALCATRGVVGSSSVVVGVDRTRQRPVAGGSGSGGGAVAAAVAPAVTSTPLVLRRGAGDTSASDQASSTALANGGRAGKGKRNILILMSDTGGGHRASAEALTAALNSLYPGQFNVSIVDMWTRYGVWPYSRMVQTYRLLGRHQLFWRIMYELGRFPPFRRFTETWCRLVCSRSFVRCMKEHQPDLVVSVHPLLQELPLRVLKRMGGGAKKVPFVTVVTDLASAHPTWFHRATDVTYVPTEALRSIAIRNGLAPEKVRLTGLPIRQEFWCMGGAPVKGRARARLGLLDGAPTCVLVGGGDGVGRLGEIAHRVAAQLAEDLPLSQLVVVCGRNEAVRAALAAQSWPAACRVTVLGFIPHLDEYMAATDVLVTKAGPGTIAEACALGVPLVLSSYMPGQEAGNVPYVTEGGFGLFERCPRGIARAVSGLLRDPQRLQDMSRKARAAGRPRATLTIAADLVQTMLPPVRQQ